MITLKGPKTLFVDVDNTLVLWDGAKYSLNEECVTFIHQFYLRRHTIIVWSAGGAEWAEQIVKQFDLERYVTACISKPDWFIDDKMSIEFMPEANRILVRDKFDGT